MMKIVDDTDMSKIKREYLDGSEQHIHRDITFPTMLKPTKLQWNEWKSFVFRNFLAGPYKITPSLQAREDIPTTQASNEIDRMTNNLEKYNSVEACINALPECLRRIMGRITIPRDSHRLIQALDAENILIGSCDGSMKMEKGITYGGHAYSLCVWDNDDGNITGKCTTPSTTKTTSLTTEMFGLLANTILVFCVTKLQAQHSYRNRVIKMYCDNQQAVEMCNDTKPPLNISETTIP